MTCECGRSVPLASQSMSSCLQTNSLKPSFIGVLVAKFLWKDVQIDRC